MLKNHTEISGTIILVCKTDRGIKMSSSIGKILKITVFGESHSDAIGVVIDGLPSGIELDLEEIALDMKRRAPGQNKMSTPRKEADLPEIKSGFFEGKTTGTPLCAVIENTNTRSKDYKPDLLRPSHADFSRQYCKTVFKI